MKAMLSYYYSTVMEQQVNGQLTEPLQIYPRGNAEPIVNTRAGATPSGDSATSGTPPGHSLNHSQYPNPNIPFPVSHSQYPNPNIPFPTSHSQYPNPNIPFPVSHSQYPNPSIPIPVSHSRYPIPSIPFPFFLFFSSPRAYHVRSGKILAVKVIPLDITLELQKQIMSELEILYKCDSSYIIGFYGAFFVENRISLCTEFMDGEYFVVKGLTYLWSLKILHRDVKPSNVLVSTRGQVKLCDFGVSTQLVNSIAKTYVGTNAYMAPERISGEQYSIHSDVWSLGISFMEVSRCSQ
ncbi:PREDICTED: dual specificity mitogen-activated protein kinase kinase 5 [Sturnus vulgaris]|uniref:dual specificity mitogen-activated protein kinase kinase 5 n=1 Tax=Sturnus vulgaris TaxID=9172 RepID=UPI00071A4E81|nr:PREDICTED: dual specificity mitogen-activated protein kinase kinase 5 [Sturnus vulgaris]